MTTNLSRRFRKALSAIAILTLAMLTGGMSYEAIGRIRGGRPFPGSRPDGGYRRVPSQHPLHRRWYANRDHCRNRRRQGRMCR